MNNSKGSLYIEKLGEEYSKHGFSREWNHLMNIKVGITDIEKKKLIEIFPNIPKSLLDILSIIDGTYYREYKNEEVLYYFFGSDVDNGEYPYYLFSYEDIIKNKDNAKYFSEFFSDYLSGEYDLYSDDRISTDALNNKWLCFSDCMNNGGTSKLYIDFTPSSKGVSGQVIRYLHDPDEIRVIADSFDEFLDMLIKDDFKFIHDDDF